MYPRFSTWLTDDRCFAHPHDLRCQNFHPDLRWLRAGIGQECKRSPECKSGFCELACNDCRHGLYSSVACLAPHLHDGLTCVLTCALTWGLAQRTEPLCSLGRKIIGLVSCDEAADACGTFDVLRELCRRKQRSATCTKIQQLCAPIVASSQPYMFSIGSPSQREADGLSARGGWPSQREADGLVSERRTA